MIYPVRITTMPIPAAELLKPPEAAVVAGVSMRDVNRVVDEDLLPTGLHSAEDGRRLRAAACPLIAFYFASARRLAADERLAVLHAMAPRLSAHASMTLSEAADEDWTWREAYLAIDLGPFVRAAGERLDKLAAARALIEISPDILSGAPVVRGTRVPVHDVAASVAAGLPMERILSAYPSLDARKVELAAFYAAANPPRGRPRVIELPAGAKIVTDRRVARRKAAA
jgi:uncharacterized protein (DUF433 family)